LSLAYDLGLTSALKNYLFESFILVLQNNERLKASVFILKYGQRAKDSFPNTTQITGECGKENARIACSV